MDNKSSSPSLGLDDLVFKQNASAFLFPSPRSKMPSSISAYSPSFVVRPISMSESLIDSTVPSMMNDCQILETSVMDIEITTDSGCDNTRDQSGDEGAMEAQEDSHYLVVEGVKIVLRNLAGFKIYEDFDGVLDSIRPPWEEDAELQISLEMDSEELEAPTEELPSQTHTEELLSQTHTKESLSQTHTKESLSQTHTKESLSQTLPEPEPEVIEEAETLPDPPLKLTKSASCDELRDAKEIINKLQEILYNPSESDDRKVSQGQKLVRSLSDLLLVSAKDDNGGATSNKVPAQNQRSKSFTGLKKSYAKPDAKPVNVSVIPSIKMHKTEFSGRLKIKKNDHEPRRGPLKAIPLENLRNSRRTPEKNGMVKIHTPENVPLLTGASSTPLCPSGTVRNNNRVPTPRRKFHSDGPVELQKVELSPSKQPQKKKEGSAKLIVQKRAGSLGSRGTVPNKMKENLNKPSQ